MATMKNRKSKKMRGKLERSERKNKPGKLQSLGKKKSAWIPIVGKMDTVGKPIAVEPKLLCAVSGGIENRKPRPAASCNDAHAGWRPRLIPPREAPG